MPPPSDGALRAVTKIPGDGIGPLVTNTVEKVMEAMQAPVYFEKYDVTGNMPRVPEEVIESIRKNKMCLKGGLAMPMGGGVSSLNMQLRRDLDLYASLVNCFNLRGLQTKHGNVDILVIRENTEGEYSGLEHEIIPGVVESLKGVGYDRSRSSLSVCSMLTTYSNLENHPAKIGAPELSRKKKQLSETFWRL